MNIFEISYVPYSLHFGRLVLAVKSQSTDFEINIEFSIKSLLKEV